VKGIKGEKLETDAGTVENVNAKGIIYSMWIIVLKCEGGCVTP